jgi:signal transduction histidine kinase
MNKKEPLIDLLIHDLTGPISVVVTSVQNLLKKSDKYGTSDQQKEVLERILRNSSKAKTLLQELVEVFRSEEGRFCRESLFVQDLMRESFLDALEITSPQNTKGLLCCATNDAFFEALRGNDIIVKVEGKYHDAPFHHDYRKIRQIVRNLVSNALKHRKKQVIVTASGDEDLVLSVTDDGFGISEKEQESLFHRFADLKDKTGADAQGLGFGLSCVKVLVEAIGGEIAVRSGEGAGTCFTLRIPPLSETQF